MKQYRVRIQLEEADEVAGDYKPSGHCKYVSAASDEFETIQSLYFALTPVAYHWRIP